jgi:hypothetical protein
VERPIIVDQQGFERDWDWLVEQFGPISLERATLPAGAECAYRIVRLQDAEGPAVQIASIENHVGTNRAGARVVRHWPDAPMLPAWPPPTSRWRTRGVFGSTDKRGCVGFGMGPGEYYSPPHSGPCGLWIADPAGPSDYVEGLGMLGLSNHRHIDVCFQLQPVEAEPTTPEPAPPALGPWPPEQWWQDVFGRLDAIISLLEKRASRSRTTP